MSKLADTIDWEDTDTFFYERGIRVVDLRNKLLTYCLANGFSEGFSLTNQTIKEYILGFNLQRLSPDHQDYRFVIENMKEEILDILEYEYENQLNQLYDQAIIELSATENIPINILNSELIDGDLDCSYIIWLNEYEVVKKAIYERSGDDQTPLTDDNRILSFFREIGMTKREALLLEYLNLQDFEVYYLNNLNRRLLFNLQRYIHEKLTTNLPKLKDFLATCQQESISQACNKHFYSGMNELDSIDLNMLTQSTQTTNEKIYYYLIENLGYNPVSYFCQ